MDIILSSEQKRNEEAEGPEVIGKAEK